MSPPITSRDAPYQPGETAILVVDMQKKWLTPGHDQVHNTTFYQHTSSVTIPNIARLLKAARENGVEVIHTIIQSLTNDGRDMSLDHKLSGPEFFVGPSDPLAEEVDGLKPIRDEILLKVNFLL